MIFAVVFFLNSAANFVFGVVLGAWLGPAEFGRYATVALAATTLGGALFAWLRLSSLRFSGDHEGRREIAASLDLGYIIMMALLYFGVGVAALFGLTFGLAPLGLALMPLLAVAFTRVDYSADNFARATRRELSRRSTACASCSRSPWCSPSSITPAIPP